MALEVGTGAAAGVAAEIVNKHIVAPLMQRIDDLIHLDRNTRSLQLNLERLKRLLQDISTAFENDKKRPADSIAYCLQRMDQTFGEATRLTASQGKQSFLGWLKIPRQVTEMNTKFDQLFQDLRTDLQIFLTAQQIVSASPPQGTNVLLQPVPEGGFVGSVIESAKNQLQTWITGKAPQVRVIGVYGMAGVGKTSLLKSVYNFYKVSHLFDVVIWVIVSQDYNISELPRQIAEAIDLDLSRTSNTSINTRTMMLSASLKDKKFLLFLDDIWSSLGLQELGVEVGTEKGSKVVFSTRNRGLALAEADESINVKPLSMDQGWELFQIEAFKGGPVPEDLKDCARKIADECEGLPLAITVVAAAMRNKKSEDEWDTSLSLMKIADPSFPDTHPRVDKELYRKLRWSYDDLPPYLQNCFLYSAMYSEDCKIHVEDVVNIWISEGFVKSKEATYSMDLALGRSYLKILIDRGLFQNYNFEKQSKGNVKNPVVSWKARYITTHDVIRDMAIYIGEEDNYLCLAGQGLKDFPHSPSGDCKRMSLYSNEIEHLPNDLVCTQLVSLILSRNPLLCNIPESFLMNLTSLRVLDLHITSIQSVPTSVGQLRLLQYLSMARTGIRELPEEICNLSKLQFLNLSCCDSLSALPCMIGKLTQLQCLYLQGCSNLVLPLEICQLTSLKRLTLDIRTKTGVMALKGLTNLIQLYLTIYIEFEAHETMKTWLEMRHLWLEYQNDFISSLPSGMQNIKKLKTLTVKGMAGSNLPNWICAFQQLEWLQLRCCNKLKELPHLERLPNLKILKLYDCNEMRDLGIGSSGNPVGFPMLERLDLISLPNLQSMVELSCNGGVLKEGILLKLRVLKIRKCPELRKLPAGIEKLPNLKVVHGCQHWWKNIIWENNMTKMYFHQIFKEIRC